MNTDLGKEVLEDICIFNNRQSFALDDGEYILDTRDDGDGITYLVVSPTVLSEYHFDKRVANFWCGVGMDNPKDGCEELRTMQRFFNSEAVLSSDFVRAYGNTLEKNGCSAVDTMVACQAVIHALQNVAKQIGRYLAEEEMDA